MKTDRRAVTKFSAVLLAGLLSACGAQKNDESSHTSADAEEEVETIVNLEMTQGEFALRDYPAITNVVSSVFCNHYFGPYDGPQEEVTSVTLYGPVWGCIMRVHSFKMDDELMTPVEGRDFNTYAAGEKALFAGENGSEIGVSIVSQLPAGSLNGGTLWVTYRISETIDIGNTDMYEAMTITSANVWMTVDQAPEVHLGAVGTYSADPVTPAIYIGLRCDADPYTNSAGEKWCKGDNMLSYHAAWDVAPEEITRDYLAGIHSGANAGTVRYMVPSFAQGDYVYIFITFEELGITSLDELNTTRIVSLRNPGKESYTYVTFQRSSSN